MQQEKIENKMKYLPLRLSTSITGSIRKSTFGTEKFTCLGNFSLTFKKIKLLKLIEEKNKNLSRFNFYLHC